MPSTASSHQQLGCYDTGRRRRFRRIGAGGSPKRTGVMFGGLLPVAHDPGVDPQPGACFNCWTRGHRRLDCPHAQVCVHCYNCGRRGVTLDDCPRCCVRHREHVAKERAKKKDEEFLVAAARQMQLADNLSSTLDNGNRENREYRVSPSVKRTRADSGSKNFYFHLGRVTPDDGHARYSSSETVVIASDDDGYWAGKREPPNYPPSDKGHDTSHMKADPDDNNKNTDVNHNDSSSNNSGSACGNGSNNTSSGSNNSGGSGSSSNNNNNNNTCYDEVVDHDEGAELTGSRGDSAYSRMKYARLLASAADKEQAETIAGNSSACEKWSACEERGSMQPRSPPRGANDASRFLILMDKIKNLSLPVQELIVLQVVAEREMFRGDRETFVDMADPVQDFSDLMDAIAHLPMDTRNAVLFGIGAERKYAASHNGAQN